MPRHCVFPGLEHLAIVVLLNANTPLILDFSEFSGAFLIHAVLKISTHGAISLTNLTKNISLVRLLLNGDFERVLLVSAVLSINIGIDCSFIVVLEPFSLLF